MKFLARFAVVLIVLGALGVYLFLGYFQLEPDEAAVVLRLGRYQRTVGPGPHFHLLFLESVERESIIVEREEFGFRTIDPVEQAYEERAEEKRMLTTDTNLINVPFVVQWQVRDIDDYRFNADAVPTLIRGAAQAAMGEIVAQHPIDSVLTTKRGQIATAARIHLQELLDGYGAGVHIEEVELQDVNPPDEVRDAFREVISAEQDRERLILEAQGYAEQIVPIARGEAEALLNQAEAYKETRVLEARGEAERFNALFFEYEKAPEVTRERLYIETLEEILPGMEKVIIEEGKSERVLPYLPLGPARRAE